MRPQVRRSDRKGLRGARKRGSTRLPHEMQQAGLAMPVGFVVATMAVARVVMRGAVSIMVEMEAVALLLLVEPLLESVRIALVMVEAIEAAAVMVVVTVEAMVMVELGLPCSSDDHGTQYS